MPTQDTPSSSPVVDIVDVLREKFTKGEGVVCLQENTPDAALLLTIKRAASYGKPFTVIPADSFLYVDAKGDTELAKLTARHGKTVTSPVTAEGKHFVLNPMDAGSDIKRLTMVARMASVELTTKQQEVGLRIIRSLPAGAGIRDFLDACREDAAERLGISAETLETLTPLLAALESVRTKAGGVSHRTYLLAALESARSKAGDVGPRTYIHPALEAMRDPEVESMMDEILRLRSELEAQKQAMAESTVGEKLKCGLSSA